MKTNKNTTESLVKAVVEGIREKKGRKITVMDMAQIEDAICDYMVIAEGNTPTQVDALEGSVWENVRKQVNDKPIHVHKGSGEWIALDYVTVIVHLFVPELRSYYNIEGLWADALQTHLPDEE